VNNNFHHILHHSQVIADYWSTVLYTGRGKGAGGYLSLTHSFRREPLNLGPHNLALKKPEESFYRTVLKYWETIILFCHNAHVWQTDR